jgi:cobalt-precorrin-5B (C1)-methyltransferase
LAERTCNAAFGVLEGLALLGTSGIAQPLSATDSLDACRQDLQTKVLSQPNLVFCIGSHSRHIAEQQGFSASQVIQTANWIGALLVEAALRGARSVRLVGYQGKLIKLAGGIFNTSSHIADAKLEIICAAALQAGAGSEVGRAILACPSADAAYAQLVELGWSERVFQRLAQQILQRCQAYIQKYAEVQLPVAVLLLDRQGRIISSAESTLITSD